MKTSLWAALTVVACLLLAPSVFSQDIKLPVPVPDGTKVMPVKIGDSETPVDLKPAEQVAFLFVSSIWNLEQRAVDKDMGPGRLCTLGELIKGVKDPGGNVFGLKVTPAKDSNYRYDLLIVGQHAIITAAPRVKGIGSFAMVGAARGFGNTMYYNPDGPDLTRAQKVTEMGYEGDGFSR